MKIPKIVWKKYYGSYDGYINKKHIGWYHKSKNGFWAKSIEADWKEVKTEIEARDFIITEFQKFYKALSIFKSGGVKNANKKPVGNKKT